MRSRLDSQEKSADANGAKVSYEEGFCSRVNGGEEVGFEQGEDDGDAADEEDGGEESEETQGRDGVDVVEGVPGDHGAEEDEEGRVDHEVDDDGERGVFGRGVAAMGEAAARAEGDEEVVDADGGGEADAEYGGEEVEGDVGGGADHLSLVGELVEPVEDVAYDDAENYAYDALVEDGDQEPFFEDAAGCTFGEET